VVGETVGCEGVGETVGCEMVGEREGCWVENEGVVAFTCTTSSTKAAKRSMRVRFGPQVCCRQEKKEDFRCREFKPRMLTTSKKFTAVVTASPAITPTCNPASTSASVVAPLVATRIQSTPPPRPRKPEDALTVSPAPPPIPPLAARSTYSRAMVVQQPPPSQHDNNPIDDLGRVMNYQNKHIKQLEVKLEGACSIYRTD
jgi:hypothetical protein